MIISTEIILFTLHKTLKIKYFENYYESKLRYGHYDIYLDLKSKKNDLITNSHKEKIAIFGGSSAKGFGVNFSFYDILNHVLNDSHVVHNYSLNEASFHNNQNLILDKVIKFYDKILIYAGHNEIYPFLIDQNRFVALPSGGLIGSKNYYNYRNYYLASIDQIFNKKKLIFSYEYFQINFLNRSRIFNIFQKINFYLYKNHISFSPKDKSLDNHLKINLFGNNINKIIIDKFDKEMIVNNYLDKLIILKKNNPDKHFIVSEVLSNYFFTPFSNYIDIKNEDELFNIELNYVNLYSKLLSKKYNDINYFQLGYKSSHDYLINSLICLNQNGFLSTKCHNLAIMSNQKDNLPLRILPNLNKKIRSLNPRDFSVIHFTEKFKDIKYYDEFNSFFIDFQHPSEKGHLMIANEFLKNLNVSKIESDINKKCVNPKLFFEKNEIKIPRKYSEKKLIEMKLIFLSHFFNNSLIKQPTNLFINAAKNRNMCNS
jgi:hypothetical protein